MLDYTPEQKSAITSLDCNTVVSAGAGSGKTRVLVERFLYILSQSLSQPQAQPVLAQEILAITFTRKAATEMRERIRLELEERQADATEDQEFWQRQLASLDRAQISTIHSFCNSLLKSNPVECDLDPAFIVGEDSDNDEFLTENVREFLRQELQKGSEDAALLCAEYGSYRLLQQLETLLKSSFGPEQEENLWLPYEAALAQIETERQKLLEACKPEFLERLSAKNQEVWSEKDEMLKAALADLTQPASLDFLADLVNGQLSARSKADKDLVKELRDTVTKLEAYPACRRAEKLLPAWQSFLQGLENYLAAARREQGFLSFDDLEKLALQLLSTHPDVLARVRGRYKYVMVDEFQDTNERQRQLVYLLSGGDKEHLRGQRLFVVGDPKQSIYRFRGADVSVFAQVRKEILDSGGRDIVLSDNFRTVDRILQVCNDVFSDLLGEDRHQDVFFEKLRANRSSRLTPAMLVLTYQKEEAQAERQAEARWIAAEIVRLHQEGLAFKEMVLLFKAMTPVELYAAALQQAGVPYVIVDGRGFYERQEVIDLMNLLTVLLDAGDNLALTAVLRSPYFGLDDETLTRLYLKPQVAGERINLWQSLGEAAGAAKLTDERIQPQNAAGFSRTSAGTSTTALYQAAGTKTVAGDGGSQLALLQRAYDLLSYLRQEAACLSLPDLCQTISRVLQPELVQLLQERGQEKLANYQKFMQLAKSFALNKNGTTAAFLERIRTLRQNGVREAAGTVAAADAVSLMTIHKAKGLEFATVFLPYLDGGSAPDREMLKYQPGYGLGIMVRSARGELVATPVLEQIKAHNQELDREERARLLYVAMTRARDRLYLIGGQVETKKGPSQTASWVKDIQAALGEGYTGLQLEQCSLAEVGRLTAAPRQVPELALDEAVRQRIAPLPDYGAHNMTRFSASSLQEYEYCPRRYFYQAVARLPLPEGAAGEEPAFKLPATVLGHIVHTVLEKYDGQNLEAVYQEAVREFAGGNFELAQPARDLLEQYLASVLFQSFAALPRIREYGFQLPLLADEDRDYVITGSVDAIVYNKEGSLDIIDYKTGQPPADGTPKQGYAYQLALYKLAVEEKFNRPVRQAALHFLQNNQAWVLPDGDYRKEMTNLCREIAVKKTEAEFAPDTDKCAFCPYNQLCRR